MFDDDHSEPYEAKKERVTAGFKTADATIEGAEDKVADEDREDEVAEDSCLIDDVENLDSE